MPIEGTLGAGEERGEVEILRFNSNNLEAGGGEGIFSEGDFFWEVGGTLPQK